jgi:hypothetical protein
MPKRSKRDPLLEIEKTQEALRDNIEESKRLIQKSQQLLEKAKAAKKAD